VTDDPFAGVQLGLVTNFEDAQTFMRWASERHDCFALDLETSGLNPWDRNARIRLIQIGDQQTGWAIPYERYSGLVAEVIEDTKTPLVWHNMGFDLKWLQVQDPLFPQRPDITHDTMIAARIRDPIASAALKKISVELFGPQATAAQKALDAGMRDNGWGWDDVPLSWATYSTYGASDVVLTARVWEDQARWRKDPRNAYVYDLELAVRRICTAMEIKGFRVDMDVTKAAYEKMADYCARVAAYVKNGWGFSIGSTQQLTEWLIRQGISIERTTPKGSPSADADELKRLLAEGILPPEPKQVVETTLLYRRASKIAGTYLLNFIKAGEDDGGLVHPTINTLAARTSRMSITNPALQTLQRDDLVVRDCFVPYGDDYDLVTCDSDQIEARLFANLSRDTGLIAAFENAELTGDDFFTQMARRVHGDPSIVKKDKRRQTIKNWFYSKSYGAGVAKMAITAGVPYAHMKALDDAMKIEFPGMKQFQDRVVDSAIRDGHIDTMIGRRLRIPDPSKAYVAVNYLIQGTAADALKQSLVDMDNSGIGDYLHVPIHDEIVVSAPRDEVDDVKQILNECMTFTDPQLYPVPLTAGAEGPYAKLGDAKR